MLNQETLNYIISFLTSAQLPAGTIGYTHNASEYAKYRMVITPSDFFCENVYKTSESRPHFPLSHINGTPILFGTAENTTIDNTLIVDADLIASTYYLITRYEELIDDTRDQHGRFPSRASILQKINYLDRPLVDEYGQILRQMLRQVGIDTPEPPSSFSNIYLTHDVDKISQYRNIRGFIGGILRQAKKGNIRGVGQIITSAMSGVSTDPLYTFEWLFEQNKKRKNAHIIAFFKANNSHITEDQPHYNLHSNDTQELINLCRNNQVSIGLHTSYLSGKNTHEIANETAALSKATQHKITLNRHHYLRTCDPQDMQALIEAGITDDFTIGFADYAGFRLGTCRPVRWINPHTGELTPLTLHPLTIMECSLSDPEYMNLSHEEAFACCQSIIKQIKEHGGELVILWHNTSVSTLPEYAGYQRELYEEVIEYIEETT